MTSFRTTAIGICIVALLASAGSAQEQACAGESSACVQDSGWIRGPDGAMVADFEWVDGKPVFQGDIVVDVLAQGNELLTTDSATIAASSRRWPDGVIPYELSSTLYSSVRSHIALAVAHWNAKQTATGVTLVPRTSETAYIRFVPSSGCWSYVGRTGGAQEIGLAPACGVGAAIHEIGHAAGLWHEQSRHDRDDYVTIQWANIQRGMEHNFEKYRKGSGVDQGAYDYASIMHYPKWAFSWNGQDTIVSKQPGVALGQRSGLSRGDLGGIAALYGGNAGSEIPLENGVPVPALAAPAGSELHFVLNVPAGVDLLSFELMGGTGDADLYVRRGGYASMSQHDCGRTSSSTQETCAFASPPAGDWFVMVHAHSAFSGATLTGRFESGTADQHFAGVSRLKASAKKIAKWAWEEDSSFELFADASFRYENRSGQVLSGSYATHGRKLLLTLDGASLEILEEGLAELVQMGLAEAGAGADAIQVGVDPSSVTFKAKLKEAKGDGPASLKLMLKAKAWVETPQGTTSAKFKLRSALFAD